jgi:hypothetical protein
MPSPYEQIFRTIWCGDQFRDDITLDLQTEFPQYIISWNSEVE